MQMVINISEELYRRIYRDKTAVLESPLLVGDAIKNGKPLPVGHGRLIDAEALDRDLENAQVNLGDALSEAFDDGLTWASEVASKLPTIIEADGSDAE